MKVHVVIAPHDDELVAGFDELREGAEDLGMMPGDLTQLVDRVIHRAPQSESVLLLGRLGANTGARRRDTHADEIDEVAGDHESPRSSLFATLAIPVE